MPKIFGREVPTIVIGGGGIVALYLVYTVLFPSQDAPVAKSKPKPTVKQTMGDTDYLPADYVFQIDSLPATVVPKDAFKPLVFKRTGPGLNGVPSIDSYTYSGMAELNNESYGLLENSQTGQGDFVQPGQRWHDQWLVVKVAPDEIVVKNDSGDSTTLMAGAASEKASKADAAAASSAAGNVPVNPMVGGIGPNDLSVQPDPNQQNNNNGGNRRRRGGGRGRGGGGGGNGGGGGAAAAPVATGG